jgi:pilus assembly protein CpaF
MSLAAAPPDPGPPSVDPALVARVRDRLAADHPDGAQGAGAQVTLTPAAVARVLRSEGRPVGDATVLLVLDALRRDVVGAGPLEDLVRLEGVTDVVVNGPEQVFLDRGAGLERAPVTFPDDAAVRRLAQRLAARAGRRLDDATPYADVRLPDGTRFHAVLSPLARPGTSISLRVPRRRVFTLAELEAAGTVGPDAASLLQRVVEARLAFLVGGGTGAGKTTVLNALLSLVDPTERLVLVEDTAELAPDHPHVVGLEARPANVEGAGAVDLRTLVRQGLRMRPDRLVVGEVRGAEVTDLLAALNTGHRGGCGTVHANTAADVVTRIEGLCLAAGLPSTAAHAQLASAVEVVLHCRRDPDGTRRIGEVAVLRRGEDGTCRAVSAVRYPRDGTPAEGPGADRLAELLSGILT